VNVLLKFVAGILAALLIAALAVIAWQRHQTAVLSSRLASAQVQTMAALFDASVAKVDVKIITQYVDRVRVIHDTTQVIQREIPTYVTPATDRTFPLPVGFVRLHDAAASGVSAFPAAGPADATAATIATSVATGVIVTNYGICHETAEQLSALQNWIRERNALQSASL
jgi:hypothetical protein